MSSECDLSATAPLPSKRTSRSASHVIPPDALRWRHVSFDLPFGTAAASAASASSAPSQPVHLRYPMAPTESVDRVTGPFSSAEQCARDAYSECPVVAATAGTSTDEYEERGSLTNGNGSMTRDEYVYFRCGIQ